MLQKIYGWITLSAEKCGRVKSGRRVALACAFGMLSALAFPPINITPLLWICFPALLFLLRGTDNVKQAFVTGWCFAFGFFLIGLYWIAAAMFVDIAHFWWAVPLAVAGLPLFFALYYGIAAALARRIGLQGLSGILVFALCWFLADEARGHMLTGFPWILVGYTWSSTLPMLQITSMIGIYGLTLITLLCASLPAALADNKKISRAAFLGSLFLLGALALGGIGRLHMAGAVAMTPDVRLRLVQPNIDQAHKWAIKERGAHFQYLLDLTSAPADKPVTHIVWPETAATFYLMEDPDHRQMIADHLPPQGSLLTGVIRRELGDKNKLDYYNSLIAVNDKAQVLAGYDKFHLVPFGEYIPFRTLLPLRTLANLGLDFSTGDGVRSIRVAGLPAFSALICYEAIFPGEVVDAQDRPSFMLNITNDGWYGKTAGPYQHFAIVKVRAIEEGLPLVRAANTGISGVVDAYGRVIARMGVGKSGFLDTDLPQALPPTWFSQYGHITLWILFGLVAAMALLCRILTVKVFRSA